MSSKVPLRNSQDEVIGVVGISTDVTDRQEIEDAYKEAKERAEVANQAKSYFMASLGHEFRTPLSHIIGLSDIMKTNRGKISTDEQDEYLTGIHEAGNDLLGLINDVILFSKIETGHFKVDSESVNLKESIEKVVRNNSHRLQLKSLTIETEYSKTIPKEVYGDPRRIRQILINLISNAIKFTEKGGIKIKVQISPDDSRQLEISVTDSGIGIAHDKIPLLFQKFSQVHSEYTDQRMGRYRGVGLGLAITKELVELMDGHIGVTSRFGKGSTFYFTLPISESLPKTQPQHQTIDGVSELPEIVGDRFLLVEEDQLAQRYTQVLFENKKFTLDIAKTGKEALKLLNKKAYALVFMDIGLPDMKGTEVVSRYRQSEKGPRRTPIVALSAQGLDEVGTAVSSCGMDGYLEKPLNEVKLEMVLRKWVKKSEPTAQE